MRHRRKLRSVSAGCAAPDRCVTADGGLKQQEVFESWDSAFNLVLSGSAGTGNGQFDETNGIEFGTDRLLYISDK